MKTIRSYRLQRRVIPESGRKQAILAMLVLFVLAGLGTTGFLTYKFLGRSDFFQVTSIQIQGARRISKNTILELSGVDIHTNLLALNKDRVRERLETHAWLERAEVETDWPARLTVTVKERRPVAMVALPDGLWYTDRHGVVFTRVVAADEKDFPVITGMDVLRGEGQDIASSILAEPLALLAKAERGHPFLPKQNISQVDLGADGSMTMYLANRPFPIYMGQGEVSTKYNRLVRVLRGLYDSKKFTETAFIQMEYGEDKVLVGIGEDVAGPSACKSADNRLMVG